MPSLREVRNRIKSVKNIGQITRALEAVSASRVRKAQARVLASRAYAEKAWEILLNIQAATKGGGGMHPLLTERETVNTIMIVLITSDRGLAGAFNTNIIRVAQRFGERFGKPVKYVTVGRKGRDALVRARENVIAEFSNLPEDLKISDLSPVSRLAQDAFLSGEVDDVFIAYTDFVNTLTQRPAVLGWLPLVPHEIDNAVGGEFIKAVPKVTGGKQDYEYEPSPEAILDEIVPRFTELQLYQALLESRASEHSARMVAMRNASDNAAQLASDLTLVYNKARQATITAEILDIVGGAEALQATLDKAADDLLVHYEAELLRNPTLEMGGGALKPVIEAIPLAEDAPLPVKKSSKKSDGDDLTKIEGIGPKMADALRAVGITTFAQLANSSQEELRGAIEKAGMKLAPSIPTWAKQAKFAADGDLDGLEKYQDYLVAGVEPQNLRDDLTKIEGIGPKMSSALNDAGIYSFSQLANATEEELRIAIEKAGLRLAPGIGTWAKQAKLAADGAWDELQAYQDKLVGGREV
jgi:F-type H+-transporting ATPase subunit gamma